LAGVDRDQRALEKLAVRVLDEDQNLCHGSAPCSRKSGVRSAWLRCGGGSPAPAPSRPCGPRRAWAAARA
jgi:hypothetical protein